MLSARSGCLCRPLASSVFCKHRTFRVNPAITQEPAVGLLVCTLYGVFAAWLGCPVSNPLLSQSEKWMNYLLSFSSQNLWNHPVCFISFTSLTICHQSTWGPLLFVLTISGVQAYSLSRGNANWLVTSLSCFKPSTVLHTAARVSLTNGILYSATPPKLPIPKISRT